jgi:hypothetical protein
VTVEQVGFRGVMVAVAVSGADYFRTWLEYGTSPGFGTVCCESVLQAGTYTLHFSLSTLQAGTTYHLRAFTTEGLGYGGARTDGPAVTFTTKPAEPPAFTVTEPVVWDNDCFCVYVHGGIKTNGAETSVYFEYGKTAALGSVSETKHIDVDAWGAEWLFNHQIRELAQGTTYYWRTVLENAAGITRTEISTFTTGTPPPPTPPPPPFPGTALPPTTPLPLPSPRTVPPPPPAAPAPAAPATPAPASIPAGPKLFARATISGSPRVGARLHGKPGRWSSGTRLATVRWLGCRAGTCRTIGHKTTLQLRPAHIGMRIRFEAQATKEQKTAWSLSAWSLRVRR